MKKLLSVILVITALFAVLAMIAGCTGGTEPPPEVSVEELKGTWIYTKENGEFVRYTFGDNNRYTVRSTLSGQGLTGMGDYELDGNKVKLTPSEGTDKSTHEITKFDGKTMTWGSGSFAREYVKE